MKKMKAIRKSVLKFSLRSILISLCMGALGVIIIRDEREILAILIKVIGGLLLCDALIRYVQFFKNREDGTYFNFDLFRAIMETLLGILTVAFPNDFLTFFYILSGVIVIVEGFMHLQFILSYRKHFERWTPNFAVSLLSVLIGVFVIVCVIKNMHVIIGTIILVDAVLSLCGYVYLIVLSRSLKTPDVLDMDDDDYKEVE